MTKDYPYIRAWGQLLGSMPYYINDQVERARNEKAPQDAIYRADDRWHIIEDVENEVTKERLQAIVETIKGA